MKLVRREKRDVGNERFHRAYTERVLALRRNGTNAPRVVRVTKSAGKPQHRSTRHRRPRASDLFEQRIHRIHELLEDSGAEVTWNDHVADPDNPKRSRQIDVTIKRGQHLTLVECRIHQVPQNVKWIEELIGRRESLAAQSVIAVSASGFTKGARRKAAAHGVALRDLRELTDEEIAAWGQSIGITVICYQYSSVEVTLWFDDPTRVDVEQLRREFPQHPIKLTLFNRKRPTNPVLSGR